MEIKKVIFVLPSIKTGGGNRVVIELSNQLILKNIKVDILYPNNSKDINTFNVSDEINFIKVGDFRFSKIHKLKNLLKTFKYINQNYKNEKIIFTDPIMSIFLPLVRNNNVYRFIQADDYSIFDDLLILNNRLYLYIYKMLAKNSYKYKINYIFNSKYTYTKFIQISKRNDIAFRLVHPSISHKIFFNQNLRNGDEINICIVARKHPLKGFIDFIKPFNSGHIHAINNIFVISHDDLTDFNLSGVALIRPDNDKEIALYMNKSHIFISTSWWEGFGLPSLEAMACGCAVLLTNVGGVNEYSIPNENCLVFEPRNQAELIKKLNILIEDNKLQKKLSKNAIQKANEFSWEKSINQLLEILYDIK